MIKMIEYRYVGIFAWRTKIKATCGPEYHYCNLSDRRVGAIIKKQRSRRSGVRRSDIGGVRGDDHEDESYHRE